MKVMVLLKVANNHPVFNQETYPFHGWCLVAGDKASEWWQYAMTFKDQAQWDKFKTCPDMKFIADMAETELVKPPLKAVTDSLKTVMTVDSAKATTCEALVREIAKAQKITLDPFKDFGCADVVAAEKIVEVAPKEVGDVEVIK